MAFLPGWSAADEWGHAVTALLYIDTRRALLPLQRAALSEADYADQAEALGQLHRLMHACLTEVIGRHG